jgi:hypothetical protein
LPEVDGEDEPDRPRADNDDVSQGRRLCGMAPRR